MGFVRRPTYHTREYHLREGQELVRLDLPREVLVSLFRDQLLVRLRSDWRIGPHQYPAGALISIRLDAYLEGERDFDTLFVPTARKALASYTVTAPPTTASAHMWRHSHTRFCATS